MIARAGWFICGVLLAFATAWTGFAQGDEVKPLPFLRAAGTGIADETGQSVLLRGCNLGNWLLLEPWMLGIGEGPIRDQSGIEQALTSRFGAAEKQRLLDLYRENWITQRDFDRLKSWNFNVVRLPFDGNLLLDPARPDGLAVDAFHWLDRAVAMARQAGVYVILDLHGAPGGQSLDGVTGKSGRNQFWTSDNRRVGAMLWQKIAEHFAAEPTVAAYDLLNEPYGTMNGENHDADLVGAMEQMVQAIRQVDQKHLIFVSGSFRGIEGYGNPQSHGWSNVGFTEHFYPGLYGGNPTLETHAHFVGENLASRADLLRNWNASYYVGEFNVVLDQAGGSEMMRRYFDEFAKHGWAGTLWSYKLLNREGGAHPNHWYMVTNRLPVPPPHFSTDTAAQIESFCRSLGTMEYAQAEDLHSALTTKSAPPFPLGSYAPLSLPEKREPLPGWKDTEVGDAFPRGGHTVVGQKVSIFGGGRDVFDRQDEFHFVSRPARGDFSLQAEVGLPAPTHIYAKSGLMFRASMATDAPMVMVNLKPNGQCFVGSRARAGDKMTESQLRFEAGACTLRLTRHGAAFEAAVLDNKGNSLATKVLTLSEAGSGGETGLFVLSHDAMLLSEGNFSQVDFQTASGTASAK